MSEADTEDLGRPTSGHAFVSVLPEGGTVRTDDLADAPAPGVPEGQASAPTTPARQWETLDALRGLAALAVLVFHLDPLMENNGESIPGAALGQVGVNVFFVLSGFLIASSVLTSERFDRRDFMVRRAARILPLYYASLLLTVVFIDSSPLVTIDGWADLAAHVFLVHGLVQDYSTSINGVLWSLSAEWLFYLFMAVVGPLLRAPRRAWVLVGAMVLVGVGWRLGSVTLAGFWRLPFWTSTFPGWLDVFAAGIALALIVRSARWAALARSRAAWAVVGALGTAFTVVTLVVYWHRLPVPPAMRYWLSDPMIVGWPLAFAVATTTVMAALILADDALAPLVRALRLPWLGLISYSLYVLHPLVISGLGRAWRQTGRTSMTWGLGVAVIAVSIAVAAVSYQAIERPGQRWARSRLTGRRATTRGRRRDAPA